MAGLVDLHCHLLPGVDDGARTLADSLAMARLLVEFGFTDVAPSPHNRPEYSPRAEADARLVEVRAALDSERIPLTLHPNSENYLFEERFFVSLGTPEARLLGAGGYVLVEAPYRAPVPTLPDLIFRAKVKGVTPILAHPERCMEFERKGRAAEAVEAGAVLQLDVGSLIGRYGATARKLARNFLDQGLYAIAATDLHGPSGAKEWLERAFAELHRRAGEQAFRKLLSENPARALRAVPLEP